MKYIQNLQLLEEKMEEYSIKEIFPNDKEYPFTLQYYVPGEIILHEGAKIKSLLFLVEGKARVTSSIATGKSLLLRFIHPFSIVGDIELIRDIPVQSQIQAVDECLLIGLSFDYIQRYELENPKLLHTLLEHVSYKLQTCTTASRVNLLATVENKFASYLISTISSKPKNNFAFELKTDNVKEIANLLGTTYRHLNRVIHTLVEDNVIVRSKDSIQIIDWLKLEKAANGIRYE